MEETGNRGDILQAREYRPLPFETRFAKEASSEWFLPGKTPRLLPVRDTCWGLRYELSGDPVLLEATR